MLLLMGALVLSAPLPAADQCTVVRANPNNSYVVTINGENRLAITREMAADALKLKAEIDAMKQELQAKEALISSLQNAKTQYDIVLTQQRDYAAALESTADGYKRLAKDYKKLAGEPWLTFDAGLGATGNDTSPAALVGVGIRRVKVWGFVQEDNAGVIIGTSLPLF